MLVSNLSQTCVIVIKHGETILNAYTSDYYLKKKKGAAFFHNVTVLPLHQVLSLSSLQVFKYSMWAADMRCGRDQWKVRQWGASVGKSVCLLGAAVPTQPPTRVLFQQNHWKPHHKEDRAGNTFRYTAKSEEAFLQLDSVVFRIAVNFPLRTVFMDLNFFLDSVSPETKLKNHKPQLTFMYHLYETLIEIGCCFSRFVLHFPSLWCVQVLTFLRRKEGFLSLVLKHIDTSAMMDVLLRLISCVEPPPLRLETLTVWEKWIHIHLKPNTQ